MKILSPENGFLGLGPADAVDYAAAKAVIIPFGLETSISYGAGTSSGPDAIIKASHQVELFDEELWCEPYRSIGIVTLAEEAIKYPITKALQQLESRIVHIIEDSKFPFLLGGEHTVTVGAIQAFAKYYQDLVILHFDAHADLRDSYKGDPYSHASTLRRCLDFTSIQSVVSCGIRSISAEEIPVLTENSQRIHLHWAKDKQNWNIDTIIQPLKNKPIYLTFDLDAFDSSLMPATGTPEPGGLFWEDAINIIDKAAKAGRIVGADVNELAPVEGLQAYDFLAAKLVYKILALSLLNHKQH